VITFSQKNLMQLNLYSSVFPWVEGRQEKRGLNVNRKTSI